MKAALLTKLNSPLEVRDIGWGPPDFGQVAVRVISAGICGAQLQEIRGEKGGPLPHTMGHEGCGVVQQIGNGVTTVKVGDKVCMHWRKGNGIESDFPTFSIYDEKTSEQVIRTTGKCTTWGEWAVVSENRVTAVPPETPSDLCVLLGCSLSTALATIENEAGLRFGQSVLVVGTGGLGSNLIRAARFANAGHITACDCHESKRALALALGADDFTTDISKSKGKYDCVIDTTGNPNAMRDAFAKLAPSGKAIMIGQPKPGASLELTDAKHFFDGDGKTLLATQGGRFNPSEGVRRYVALYQSGALKLDGLITHRIDLADINEAIALVTAGEAGRIVINMPTP